MRKKGQLALLHIWQSCKGVVPDLWCSSTGRVILATQTWGLAPYDPHEAGVSTVTHYFDSYHVSPMMLVKWQDLCSASVTVFYEVKSKRQTRLCEVTRIAWAQPRHTV